MAKILDTLAKFSLVLIVIGLLKQVIYFSAFNIPITYFIGVPDFGLLVSQDLLFIVPVNAFLFIPVYYIYTNIKEEEHKNENYFNAKIKGLSLKWKLTLAGSVFIFGLLLTLNLSNYIMRLFLTTINLIGISLILISESVVHNIIKVSSRSFLIYWAVILFIIAFVAKSAHDIYNTKNGMYTGTVVKCFDTTYVSTSSSYFIGKTADYTFIYNSHDSASEIIPNSKIEKIHLKSR